MHPRPFPLSHSRPHPPQLFSLETAAELTGMHPEMILEFARARVVAVLASPSNSTPLLDSRAIYRLRQIQVLRHQRSMSLRSIRYVVRLLDRLETAEAQLRSLRDQAPA